MRHFGHTITYLHIDVRDVDHGEFIVCFFKYLSRYCSESLVALSIQNTKLVYEGCVFLFLKKPFPNLKMLQIQMCDIMDFPINELFPNLQILRYGLNKYRDNSVIKVQNPSVRHLSFHDIQMHAGLFELNDLEDIFKLNPQLETLELHMTKCRADYPVDIFLCIKEYLPNLRHLVLEGSKIMYATWLASEAAELIHFDQIESFSLREGRDDMIFFPFSFSKLKHIELIGRYLDLDQTFLLDIIRNNQQLTSITLRYRRISNIFNFFHLEHVIQNVEDLIIHGVADYIPYASVCRFLKQNVSLQTFSIHGTTYAFDDFCSELVETQIDLKIRNKSLEFYVEKTNDQSLAKYVISCIQWYTEYRKYHLMELNLHKNSQLVDECDIYDFPYRIYGNHSSDCGRRPALDYRVLARRSRGRYSQHNLKYLQRNFGIFNREFILDN